ncbi:MAG: hypothetical protein QNJ94_21155 [Alphaproteobacteria bacterium]|nr:hypothetical protein [Alphaproteobacteria bacterium]
MTLLTSDRRKPALSDPTTACFTVHAHADPGVLPRVLEPFAKRGLVPTRLHATADGPGELTIDLQVAGMAPELAKQVAAGLRMVWGVSTVLTSARRGCRAA